MYNIFKEGVFMKNLFVRIISLILCFCLIFCIGGCAKKDNDPTLKTVDLMGNIKPQKITTYKNLKEKSALLYNFSVNLFKNSIKDGENSLVSPLSVLYALSMTANGAENDTLKEIEKTLGQDIENLNKYVLSYTKTLPKKDKFAKFNIANSIWFKNEGFKANKNFLQTNANYYNVALYKAPFNNATCKKINDWVNKNTNKMIPQIINELPDDTVMCLINALAFEAEWQEPYLKDSIKKEKFYKENGKTKTVEFMNGSEQVYLEDKDATGFVKYYKGGDYAFIALLPKKGISVNQYVSSLNGKKLNNIISNKKSYVVYTKLPKFKTEHSLTLNDTLYNMGIKKAFNQEKAEFGKLGKSSVGNIYIGDVLHKTYIDVNENGTSAAAATAIITKCTALLNENIKKVYLDRPFVYMLYDCKNNMPFFMGTLMDV